jgi:tetratricopeptide (TPR) repeat protein
MRIGVTGSHRMSGRFGSALLNMLCLLLVLAGAVRARAQASIDDGRLRTLEHSVRVAAEQHAEPEHLGALWHSLGVEYQTRFDYNDAQNAYEHAIALLRKTALKADYADSLHGLGEVYVTQSKLKQARNSLAEALGVFEELGDRRSAASVRSMMALALLREHKFREAETEASDALAALESLGNADRNDVENTLLTRARALAGEGRSEAGLKDVARARAMAADSSDGNSIDAVTVLLVEGEIQVQAGQVSAGVQSMREALRRARALTMLPPTASASVQASILRREAASLRRAHLDEDAKTVEVEMKQAESAARAGCNGCTVSVTSLLPQ